MEVFVLDPKTRMADLNHAWISTIKEFKVLLQRNKNKHEQAIKEFSFLYHYCDYRSKFRNYSEVDKLRECKRNADMPEEYELESDLDMFSAVVAYRKIQKAPSLEALNEVREGLHTSIKFVKKLREIIDDEISRLDLKSVGIVDEDSKGKKKKSPLELLDEAVSALLKRGKELPTTIENLKALEEKVKAEMAETVALRGNAVLGEREEKGSQVRKVGDKSIFED